MFSHCQVCITDNQYNVYLRQSSSYQTRQLTSFNVGAILNWSITVRIFPLDLSAQWTPLPAENVSEISGVLAVMGGGNEGCEPPPPPTSLSSLSGVLHIYTQWGYHLISIKISFSLKVYSSSSTLFPERASLGGGFRRLVRGGEGVASDIV